MKQVILTRQAKKALEQLPPERATQLVDKIKLYADNPEALRNNIKALKGIDGFRLRVGEYPSHYA